MRKKLVNIAVKPIGAAFQCAVDQGWSVPILCIQVGAFERELLEGADIRLSYRAAGLEFRDIGAIQRQASPVWRLTIDTHIHDGSLNRRTAGMKVMCRKPPFGYRIQTLDEA